MSKGFSLHPMNRLILVSLLCFTPLAAQSGHVVHYDLKMQELNPSFPPNSEVTWTLPRPAPATLSISRAD